METPIVISLKLVIDTKEKRVLFGEASKDCADFLLRVLSLPVSNLVSLLEKKEMVGSVAYLNQTLANPPPKKCYRCSSCIFRYDGNMYFSDDPNAVCPTCRKKMVDSLRYVAPRAQQQEVSTTELVSNYMVSDDLVMKPMSSCVSLLNQFNVKDLGSVQEKVVDLGMEEAVKLLKAYLETKNVLTQVFLKKDLGNPTTASQDKKPVVGKRRRQSGQTLREDGPSMSDSSVEEVHPVVFAPRKGVSRPRRKGVKKEE